MRWDGCVKVHENCGGIVRWVEAVDTPGVGFQGECLGCGREEIVVENIIPIEELDHREALATDPHVLEALTWDDATDWEENQERLSNEVSVNA